MSLYFLGKCERNKNAEKCFECSQSSEGICTWEVIRRSEERRERLNDPDPYFSETDNY